MFRVTRATFWPIRSRRPTRRNRSAPPDPEDRRDPFASDRRHLRKRPRADPARRPARLVGQQHRLGEPPLVADRHRGRRRARHLCPAVAAAHLRPRSEEHTSELQSLMRISYAVFCLKKKNHNNKSENTQIKKKDH